MKNYWKMEDFSLFKDTYAYIDHKSYLADQLFIQRKIRVHFKEEMMREDSLYCIVFCKVSKRDAAKFEEALGKLNDKMLLLGYTDYPEVCEKLEKVIVEADQREKDVS